MFSISASPLKLCQPLHIDLIQRKNADFSVDYGISLRERSTKKA